MFRPINPDRSFSGTSLAERFAKEYALANPDNLHFSAEALEEFGLRYFNEFQKLDRPKITNQNIQDDIIRTEMEQL